MGLLRSAVSAASQIWSRYSIIHLTAWFAALPGSTVQHRLLDQEPWVWVKVVLSGIRFWFIVPDQQRPESIMRGIPCHLRIPCPGWSVAELA